MVPTDVHAFLIFVEGRETPDYGHFVRSMRAPRGNQILDCGPSNAVSRIYIYIYTHTFF